MSNNPVDERRAKLDVLKAKGHRPFDMSISYPAPTNIDVVRGNFDASFTKEDGPEFVIVGRCALKRGHGKLSFLTITSVDGQIQVAIDQSKFASPLAQLWDWPQYEALDLGDIVAVKGRLAATQRGEITIWADTFRIVSKALTPPPDKVHGLNDPELKYRLRHVDMWTNPDTMKVFRQRSNIIRDIRMMMYDRGFDEVETPILQASAGGAIAKPFVTHHNALDIGMFLRIAPELYLKKLLIGGMNKVFEIGKNFRNEGISPRHNPEFTSMEAYEAFGNYETMMKLVEAIIVNQVKKIHGRLTDIPYKEHLLNFTPPFKRVTLQELVGNGSPEQRFQVYEDTIESTLIQPTFVMHMPASVVPLARPFDNDYPLWQGYAETFELVIGGMEIAPGYTELNDPDVQLENFQKQAKDGHVMDQEFVDAIKTGMPPAGGLGLGIDRLVAILTNQTSIRDVIAFPLLRPRE